MHEAVASQNNLGFLVGIEGLTDQTTHVASRPHPATNEQLGENRARSISPPRLPMIFRFVSNCESSVVIYDDRDISGETAETAPSVGLVWSGSTNIRGFCETVSLRAAISAFMASRESFALAKATNLGGGRAMNIAFINVSKEAIKLFLHSAEKNTEKYLSLSGLVV
jgi:hypothetical protein